MENFTLSMDFSTLDGPKTEQWLRDFQKLAEDAFSGSDDRHRLLGNLLVLEAVHTHDTAGPEHNGRAAFQGTLSAVDTLWDYLAGRAAPREFADFANNLYACLLAYDVGEDLTDEQIEFDKEYFSGVDYLHAGEDTAAGWAFCLLLLLVDIEGGRLDYDAFAGFKKVDFSGIEEMLNLFDDACIEMTETPCPSNRGGDILKAIQDVHLTPLYRQIIAHIQEDLQRALAASPEEFASLREEYREKTIIPEEYAAKFLEY